MCIASGAMACGISGSSLALVCYEEESETLLNTIANLVLKQFLLDFLR